MFQSLINSGSVLLPLLVRGLAIVTEILLTASRQERIDHGVLIRWTKGFGVKDTEGKDAAAMFRAALDKYVSVKVHETCRKTLTTGLETTHYDDCSYQ